MVNLTSSDWQDVYADNAGHVRQAAGGPRGGHWNVLVDRPGTYEIALRRWPREIGLALGDKSGEQSKALAITTAHVTVGGQTTEVQASPEQQEAVIKLQLPPGRTTLHAWFSDAGGQGLCGAFYAYVRRVE